MAKHSRRMSAVVARSSLPLCLLALSAFSPARAETLSETPAPAVTLETLQQTARERNPTLAMVEARLDAAVADTKQSRLWPNLHVAYQEELVNEHTTRGMFLRQILPISGRLRASEELHARDAELAQVLVEKQRIVVDNSVRKLFRHGLVLERKIELQKEVVTLLEDEIETIRQLVNVGLEDRTDLLEAEMDLEHERIELQEEQIELRNLWTKLASMVGDPTLKPAPLEGDALALPPPFHHDRQLARLLEQSAELRVARAELAVAEAALLLEKREGRPDASAEFGYRYNYGGESEEEPAGWEAAFSVGLDAMLWNRNRSGIRAAEQDVRKEEREIELVELGLRAKFSSVFHEYEIERAEAKEYLEEILPLAEQVHELALGRYEDFGEDYKEVLEARGAVLEVRSKLLAAAGDAWQKAVLIEGLLLDGGLKAPNLHLLENSGLGTGEVEFN